MRRDLSAWMQSLSSVARRPTQIRGGRPRSVTLAGQSLGGGESLERRSMLAVTASLSFGRLFIRLNAGGDEATLTNDGTNYTVEGTGYSATTFALSSVDALRVYGNYSQTNTKFTIGKGSDVVDDILVNEAVGTTVINQAIAPTTGEISIASPTAISLNANLTTVDAGISLAGPVTLGGTSADTITVGSGGGGATFLSTVDGLSRLVVNATDATVFGGAVGGKTALASLETDAGGQTVIGGGSVTTVGVAGQVYGDAVRIQANATFNAGSGPVTFSATVDGSRYVVTDTIAVGTTPWFIALSKDGSKGYVANENSNTVSVIDMATRTVIATVTVGSQPFDIQLSPDGSQVWTANRNSSSGSVSVIDTDTNTLVTTIATGALTDFLTFSPNGSTVYASNSDATTVSVIDADPNSPTYHQVVDTISVTTPRPAVFSLDGSTAYVPSLSGNSVAVIDTATNEVTTSISVGSTPYFAALVPDGKRLYVPNFRGDSVSVIDTDAASGTYHTVIATIATGSRSRPQYLTVSADGAKVYVVCDGDDDVVVINTADNTIAARPAAGSYPVYPALSPDGTTLYVSNVSGNTLSVIDTATNTNTQEVIVGSGPYGVGVSPDSETIYVVNSYGDSVSVIEVNPQFSLTVNSTGLTTFGGVVGGVGPLASLTTNAGGTTKIAGGSVRTIGPAGQTYNDAVELTGAVRFRSELAGPITLEQTLDGAYRAEFIAGEGAVLFKGAIGSVAPLAGLKITSAASTTGQSTLSLDGSVKGASPHGLWLGAGVSNVSFPNGGTIKNFAGNGIYAPDEGPQPAVTSRFAFGTDGWTVGNFLTPTPSPTDPDWVASGGNPDAFIRTTDLYDWTGFLAPSQFLGNWVADKVTSLSFDLRVSGSDEMNDATVVLTNGTISISTFGPYPQPNDTWVSYTVDVTSSSGWFYTNDGITPGAAVSNADFAAVLANVTALRINADWEGAEPDEQVDLDNVVLLASFPNENLTFTGLTIEGNGESGVFLDTAANVVISEAVIRDNAGAGVSVIDGEDIAVRFSVIQNNAFDGVLFTRTTGTIEGNEVIANGEDGIHLVGDCCEPLPQGGRVEVLGNIIRDNVDDGVHFANGRFVGEDFEQGESPFSLVSGNTIELNGDNGVELQDAYGVLVGGPSVVSGGIETNPSDINFINLNGNAGVYATGDTLAFVVSNEIDSNGRYGVENDGAEDLLVGYPVVGFENTIRRNGIAGVYAHGVSGEAVFFNNDISENPIGVMLTSASNMLVGGPNDFPGEEEIQFGNRIFDNGEGVRATGDFTNVAVVGNLIEGNLTGATLASAQGLYFGVGDGEDFSGGNIVQNNNEGLRASGDLTGTVVEANQFLDNTKVGIALQSAKNLTVGGLGEDSPNVISGSPVGLSASGTMTGTEVVNNEFSDNVIGIALSKATGMLVGGNTIDESAKYGISVTGNNAGTEIVDNTVTNTQGQPGYEHGIYLDGARNIDVIGNTVSDSKGAGIYVTGNTLGTAVQGNSLDGNRFGIALINATNAVIGGLGEDEGNTIVGGGDSAAGDYRDGIYASGTLTGSSITGTDITNASTGVLLESAQGLLITETTVTDSQRFGLFARGDNTGTTFTNGTITGTGGVPSTEHGIALYDAQNLTITNTDVSDSLGAGLFVTGSTTGTVVQNNDFDDNRFGIVLVNATNAVIGGTEVGEDNRIVGGGNPGAGEYRDGIYAAGTNTGSSITQTKIEKCWTGINLDSSLSLTITDATVEKATGYGIYAKGTNTGTLLDDINVEQDPVSSTSVGSVLDGATGLTIDNSSFIGDGTALYVIGGANGTIIEDSDIFGEDTGLNVLGSTGLTVRRNDIAGSKNGLIVTGTSTGTSITANSIIATTSSGAATSFYSVTGATFDDNTTLPFFRSGFGLYVTGDNTGTVVRRNVFNNNVVGVYLNAATNIVLGTSGSPEDGNTISNSSFAGLQAAGACTNSFVYDTTWTSNAKNVDSTATGLTISPAAP
jgi:YVTN family beta-propeller protein/parallel beta-helix repeat protein